MAILFLKAPLKYKNRQLFTAGGSLLYIYTIAKKCFDACV